MRILLASVFLRALGTGMIGVLLGIHLARLQVPHEMSGIVVSAGLAGAAVAALTITLRGDRWSRRGTLITLALLGAVGGAGLVITSDPMLMAAVSFLGMVNGMGRDRGAALILEQVILPEQVSDADRTRVFAWYNVLQDVGQALGGLLAALPDLLERAGVDRLVSLRWSLALYALLCLLPALVYLRLPAGGPPKPPVPLSPESRRILWKICPLFAMDSLGGGFLTSALLAYYFHGRFPESAGWVPVLFFGSRVLNALSHFGAAWLAKRIGLVNTMVFTHIPSSLLLATVPFAPNFGVAALLFLLREGLVEMDVPTRQSYVMAVVRPEERTFASGMTGLVRMGSWAVAPSLAGLAMKGVGQAAPLFVGAGLKIVYDVLLYVSFRRLPPPEERKSIQYPEASSQKGP